MTQLWTRSPRDDTFVCDVGSPQECIPCVDLKLTTTGDMATDCTVNETPSGYVYRDPFVRREHEGLFDPVSFAMHALRILRPRHATVAVRRGRHALRIDQGPVWEEIERNPKATWAIVTIPLGTSREEIIVALLQVTGHDPDPLLIATILRETSIEH